MQTIHVLKMQKIVYSIYNDDFKNTVKKKNWLRS